jgi:hypothetical protein
MHPKRGQQRPLVLASRTDKNLDPVAGVNSADLLAFDQWDP